MIPYAVVGGYSTALDQLSVAALVDLRALLASVEELSPARQRAVLFEAFPDVFNPYAATASAVSASFYDEVREMVEVKGSFTAETLDSVESPRWYSLVGAGTAPSMFEQGGSALLYSFLSGGLTAIMSEMAADTMIGNASLDPAPMSYQRVPKSGCCAFCGLLASRGATYATEKSAGTVIGRGIPVGEGRGRGSKGVGRGIKSRGARSLGESFHDFCKCRVVAVNDGNSVQMQADADKYYDSYATARDKVADGLELNTLEWMDELGNRHNDYEWVDIEGNVLSPKERQSNILKAMRLDLGVK